MVMAELVNAMVMRIGNVGVISQRFAHCPGPASLDWLPLALVGECAILPPGGTLINIVTIVSLTTILTTKTILTPMIILTSNHKFWWSSTISARLGQLLPARCDLYRSHHNPHHDGHHAGWHLLFQPANWAGRKWRFWEEIIQNNVSLGGSPTINVTLHDCHHNPHHDGQALCQWDGYEDLHDCDHLLLIQSDNHILPRQSDNHVLLRRGWSTIVLRSTRLSSTAYASDTVARRSSQTS